MPVVHDPRLRELLSQLPNDLKQTTGGLMGIDEDQGRLQSRMLEQSCFRSGLSEIKRRVL